MADFEKVITRKAFHFNDPTLSYYQILDLLEAEIGYFIDVYDGKLENETLTIIEYHIDEEGVRNNIRHEIPLGFWLVQMVDCTWEVQETPVIHETPIWESFYRGE